MEALEQDRDERRKLRDAAADRIRRGGARPEDYRALDAAQAAYDEAERKFAQARSDHVSGHIGYCA